MYIIITFFFPFHDDSMERPQQERIWRILETMNESGSRYLAAIGIEIRALKLLKSQDIQSLQTAALENYNRQVCCWSNVLNTMTITLRFIIIIIVNNLLLIYFFTFTLNQLEI